MLKGIITHINSTKYVVSSDRDYTCVLRGIFRKDSHNALVGDEVLFDEDKLTIEKIMERKNFLIRPNIANVDYAVVISSVKKPDLDLMLLDKLLSLIILSNIKPIICFTKIDLLDDTKEFKKIFDYYNKIGIKSFTNDDIDNFKKFVSGKKIVLCGQTGAGKSSFINRLDKSFDLKTNKISDALNRGVHTTRYVSLYKIDDFYIADTPGFSALDLNKYSPLEIAQSFVEFGPCKYRDCLHINTEGCIVCNNSNILSSRYINYQKIIKEQNESSGKLFKK